MRASHVVPGGELAVVTSEEAVLYSKPSLTSPTPNVLPRMTVLVLYPEADGDFVKLSAWDADKRVVYTEEYLKKDLVSTKEHDVQGALLYYLAERSESLTVKKELLRSAATFAANTT